MTGLEIENFYKQDEKRYILGKNQEILDLCLKMEKDGFRPIINIEQMQKFMNEITMFFEFKYPDNILYDISRNIINDKTINVSKLLDIEELKYRLYHDYVQFMDCSYEGWYRISKPKRNFNDIDFTLIPIDKDGNIRKHSLLKDFIKDIENIETIENLYGKLESIATDINYDELSKCIKRHKYNMLLRNKIFELIPLNILYSKNTLPEYAYIRAKSFIRMFNKEYNLDLNMDELDKIMNKDYSQEKKVKKIGIIK